MSKSEFEELLSVIDTLLGENGCPWDKKQTHESMKISLLEECYEVLDAIDKNDSKNLCEELGDVLFIVLFHCKIAEKLGTFNYKDSINNIKNKMIYRHPHIFHEKQNLSSGEVLDNWDNLKQKEKGYKSNLEILNSIPKSLPALIRGSKVVRKCTKFGYDINIKNTLDDSERLLKSIKTDINANNHIDEDDFQSLLMNLIIISAKYDINAEFILTNAIETFINKFGVVIN